MKHLPVALAVVVAALTFVPVKQAGTGPVAEAMAKASRSDRATLRGTYTALADKTSEDNGAKISTVGKWREWHSECLRWAAKDMRGKYPGLDLAVEKVLADHFSLDDVAMSGQLAQKIDAACREVAKQSE
jgi:hypothetical protein